MAPPPPRGAMRLFTFRDIPVYVHWSWAVVALLEVQWRSDAYASYLWNVAEYLALFGLVLLHEFGHALACRSVGGRAEQILLWPLGGVAYVRPPQRPGAMLWSIAAGPLVNLALIPVTLGALAVAGALGPAVSPDLSRMLLTLAGLNVGLFVFNVLPIYPLDGGQIVRSLLWFVVGRQRSLALTAGVSLVVALVGGAAAAVWLGSFWIGLIAVYAAWRSLQALRVARVQSYLMASPRQPLARCPGCGEPPPQGPYWQCPERHAFDAFATAGACPQCPEHVESSPCIFCGETYPIADYLPAPQRGGEAAR